MIVIVGFRLLYLVFYRGRRLADPVHPVGFQ